MLFRISILSFICAILLALGLLLWPEPSIVREPGINCPDDPVQEEIDAPEPFDFGEYRITPLALYDISALVLSRKKYSDDASAISPVDLALGWGPMSNQALVDNLDISQTNRFYLWRCRRLPIPAKEISESSCNVHVIPANEEIHEALDRIVRGSIVHMSGFLVLVTGGNGFRWKSSLRRDDTGNGACEILYVQEISVE